MNASKFDQIVSNRANERVQEKIETFRKRIGEAVIGLGIKTPMSYYHGFLPHNIYGDLALILANVASGLYFQPGGPSHDNPLKPTEWPAALWERETDAVRTQLLATMDEMQKALVAPTPKENDAQMKPLP